LSTYAAVGLWSLSALQLTIGLWLLFRHRKFSRSAKRVQGLTLEPRKHRHDFENTDYSTVVEYEIDGVRYVLEGRGTSTCRWCHRKGRTVWVYFQPNQPGRGRLVGWWEPVAFSVPVLLSVYLALVLIYGKPS